MPPLKLSANPQIGVVPQPNMSVKTTTPATTTPSVMGIRAKSPQSNLIPPSNLISIKNQDQTNTSNLAGANASVPMTPVTPPTYTPSSFSAGANSGSPTTPNTGGLYGQLIQQARDAATAAANAKQNLSTSEINLSRQGVGLGTVAGEKNLLEQAYGAQVTAAQQKADNLARIAGLAAPVSVAPGSTLTEPTTGATVAGGIGGYANYQTAQQVFSQAGQYKDAVNAQGQPFTYDSSKSPQDNWQTFSTQYLPNSRTYQASLNSNGQTSNIGQPNAGGSSLASSTVNQTNVSGYQGAYKNYQDLNTQYQGAQNLGTLLTKTMSDYGINPSDPKIFNLTANEINNQLSSKGYARFLSTLSNVQSAYSNILASGGGTIPTAATNALHTIIDPNASFGAIQGAIDQLNQEVITGKLTPLANQVNNYLTNIPGSSNSQQTNIGQGQGTAQTPAGTISWDQI